jgi:SH3 domain-containing protein
MPLPTSLIDRPGRAAATAGALLATSAAVAMALAVGTAAADEPGRCVTNVNVRAEPSPTSRIVNRCQAGTAVQVGETRDGFVRLDEFRGWASAQYVAVDGATPAPAPAAAPAGDAPAPPAADDAAGDPAGDDQAETRTPAQQRVVVDGVDRTPAEDDATGIASRTTRTLVDQDGATHTETVTTDRD